MAMPTKCSLPSRSIRAPEHDGRRKMKADFSSAARSANSPARLLSRSFYEGSPERVARKILGKVLVSTFGARLLAGRIVEVEAYHGADDPAAHAFAGKTLRNAVLFGPPGYAYVYFIYGMYYCLNVSCETDGTGGGVLFRAVDPLDSYGSQPGGIEEMRKLRGLGVASPATLISSGPGRLCQAFGITRATHNGLDYTDPRSPLRIEDDGYRVGDIVATPRIGVSKAAERHLRFYLADSLFVSGKR
jgi:DNA-3-methyladenine glycosylase